MNQQNRRLNIAEEMDESAVALSDAELLLANGRYQGATTRAYYAAFHALQALLLTKGLEAKSHHGVAYLFRLHFVKTQIIDSKYSQILARTQKYREEADYHHTMEFSQTQAEDTLREVKELIVALEKQIRNHLK